ncbi:MAG TPA: fused MFS/spermidine synthase [Pirellulales bacterium]|nr:fused MFS/spermidine synthase [Pirellulales bacterium]
MIWYALTIFWSAFLLFLVQPILGKQILPWFGGTPAVWTTCLLFFQMLLLGGYLYAHAITAWIAPRAQALLHISLLGASLWFLPIVADPAYRAAVESSPTWQILALLTFTIGAPYFLISATGPLLQAWFAKTHVGSPYRLYALSNVGSLLALLSYPFVVEPRLKLGDQTHYWSWGYAAFAVFCALCGYQLLRSQRRHAASPSTEVAAPPRTVGASSSNGHHEFEHPTSWGLMALWLGLAAGASGMLMATTNQICQEVAVVPFLWILPLTLYLVSFIICFDSPRWYDRRFFVPLLIITIAATAIMLFIGVSAPLVAQIGTYSAALFACAMSCHGELVRARPPARDLTLFYLCVASGGALGGVFVALVAPAIFDGLWEFHVALVVCPALVLAAMVREENVLYVRNRPTVLAAVLLLAFCALITTLVIHVREYRKGVLVATRNFYGVVRVRDAYDPFTESPVRKLQHGTILHGMQLLEGDMRVWPTTYYARTAGVGLAIEQHPRRLATDPANRNLRIGVIGLGAGTVAALAQAGDTIRFYDINPDVIRIAQEYFYFLDETQAHWTVEQGDARLTLEKELAENGPQNFDVLVMDAFSSDAIPMHLITTECVEMYWKHLKPDGILVVNTSNRNVDLDPLVLAMAEASHKDARLCETNEDRNTGIYSSTWALVTSNEEFLGSLPVSQFTTLIPDAVQPVVWTDDYGSLWQVLRKYDNSEIDAWIDEQKEWLRSYLPWSRADEAEDSEPEADAE